MLGFDRAGQDPRLIVFLAPPLRAQIKTLGNSWIALQAIALLYVYMSKKQPGHILNFILESTQGNLLKEVNFKGLHTAKGVLDSITSGWNQLFNTNPHLAALKQMLQKIEQKDPELASLIIREPSHNHAQTLFDWN